MMKYFSKFGLGLVGVYFIITIAIFLFTVICHDVLCRLISLSLVLPWILLPNPLATYSNHEVWFAIYTVLNAGILYVIGYIVESLSYVSINRKSTTDLLSHK